MLIYEDEYDDLLIQFDALDYKVKDDLSLKIKYDEKYSRNIFGIMSINWLSNR